MSQYAVAWCVLGVPWDWLPSDEAFETGHAGARGELVLHMVATFRRWRMAPDIEMARSVSGFTRATIRQTHLGIHVISGACWFIGGTKPGPFISPQLTISGGFVAIIVFLVSTAWLYSPAFLSALFYLGGEFSRVNLGSLS